jgi:hypothetical protein
LPYNSAAIPSIAPDGAGAAFAFRSVDIKKGVVMTTFKILFLALAITSVASAQSGHDEKESLTPIERSTCLSFPAITKLENAQQGLQYKAEKDIDCDDSSSSCDHWIRLSMNNHYQEETVTDYVNDAGKVVTSKIKKETENIDVSATGTEAGEWAYGTYELGATPMDESAVALLQELYTENSNSVLLKIRKKIYEGGDICEDSFYK